MAASMVRHGRGFRTGKFRGRNESGDESVCLDFSKAPEDNVHEILCHVVRQYNVSKGRKLAFLNSFVRLLYKLGTERDLGMPIETILCCLRVGLLHDAKEMRAATLRVLRYLVTDEDTIDCLIKLQIDYLIVRSLDICLDNEIERVHAIRLIRKIAHISYKKLPLSLLYPLTAIGNDGAIERDRLLRVALETLCEIAFHNMPLMSQCSGLTTILRNVLDCHQYPRINECLLATLLHLLNHPQTRHYIRLNTDLEQLLAPFTDCHYKYSGSDSESSSREDKETRFAASKMAVVTLMHSWPGLIRLCQPDGSGIQSLVGILYLPNVDIRKGLLEVLYDMFKLKIPEWTDNFTAALMSIDPSTPKHSWHLLTDFVADEGKALLPHLAAIRTNLVENYMALVLAAWINVGLFEALVEVIVTSDSALFVRAVILLGELLHVASTLLPKGCTASCQCLPSLLSLASNKSMPLESQSRASLAVKCLSRVHAQKKHGSVPSSLYLEQLLSFVHKSRHVHRPLRISTEKLTEYYLFKSLSDDCVSHVVRDSRVTLTKDNLVWNWELVSTVLQWPAERLLLIDEQLFQRFLRRLVYFFKPTSRLFSMLQQTFDSTKKISAAGCHLMDFLIGTDGDEKLHLTMELLEDISLCLQQLLQNRPLADILLSVGNITSTMSQDYFLLIGRCSGWQRGEKYLEKTGIFQHLLDMVTSQAHVCYIKLIISSLDYSREGMSRIILAKALTSTSDVSKVYATKFLRVLLRAKVPFFTTWGIEYLVTQLYDPSKQVAMRALSVLDEAVEIDANLQSLIKIRPSLLHLGDKGAMMLCKFLSVPKGFKFLQDANYIHNEILRWHKQFNSKYVSIVDELLNEALTTYEKPYDGTYTRRSSNKQGRKNVFVPAHLYGELVQHQDGFHLLQTQDHIREYFECVSHQDLLTDAQVHQVKTALWVVGHIGSSSHGVGWLIQENIVPDVIKLAEESGVFSVRGTAFYVLCLIASTQRGTELLLQFGWESFCHTRTERWPIMHEDDELAMMEQMPANKSSSSNSTDEIKREKGGSFRMSSLLGEPKSNLIYIEEETKEKTTCDKTRNEMGESGYNTLPKAAEKNTTTTTTSDDIDIGSQNCHLSKSNLEVSIRKQVLEITSLTSVTTHQSDGYLDNHLSNVPTPVFNTLPKVSSIRERNARLKAEFLARGSDTGLPSRSQTMSFGESEHQRMWPRMTRQTSASVEYKIGDGACSNQDNVSSDSISLTPAGDACNVSITDSHIISELQITEIGEPFGKSNISPTMGKPCVEQTYPDTDPVLETEMPAVPYSITCRSSSKTIRSDRKQLSEPLIGQKSLKVESLKEDRNNSSDSSMGKSRSSSFNTNSTTSGVSSIDSGSGIALILHVPTSLSTIPSSTSLNSLVGKPSSLQNRPTSLEEISGPVHPSLLKRKQLNLSRVPSLRRKQPNPALGMMSPSRTSESFLESPSNITTLRDVFGYATLRSLKRQRTQSSDVESDLGFNLLFAEDESLSRSHSLQSRHSLKSPQNKSKLPLNFSFTSAQDIEQSSISPLGHLSRTHSVRAPKSSTGEAEFIGFTLPVDVTMLFQVHEGEDQRSKTIIATPSHTELPLSRTGSRKDNRHRLITMLREYPSHKPSTCLVCSRFQRDKHRTISGSASDDRDACPTPDDEADNLSSPTSVTPLDSASSSLAHQHDLMTITQRCRNCATTSGSMSDTEPGGSQLTYESEAGKILVRKEVMRLIINLSSSVGTKSSEQGLLQLRQKFPDVFHDLCLYSDIAHLLSTYAFRLNARRFIQELFEEMDITRLLDEPRSLLNITEEFDKPKLTTIRHDSMGEFTDAF